MYRFNRFARHNSHNQQHNLNNGKNNHHHNHHRVIVDDLIQNSAEAHSYEGLSEEILSGNQAHKKRHFKHKIEHSLRKSSNEKLSRDNSKETA